MKKEIILPYQPTDNQPKAIKKSNKSTLKGII